MREIDSRTKKSAVFLLSTLQVLFVWEPMANLMRMAMSVLVHELLEAMPQISLLARCLFLWECHSLPLKVASKNTQTSLCLYETMKRVSLTR